MRKGVRVLSPPASFFLSPPRLINFDRLLNRLSALAEQRPAAPALRELWRNYNLKNHSNDLDKTAHLNAYLQYYFPVNIERIYRLFLRHRSILDLVLNRPLAQPLRIVDLGCGPLTATFGFIAALQTYGRSKPLHVHLLLHDKSNGARDAGMDLLLGAKTTKLTVEAEYVDHIEDLQAPFNVVLSSNFLNELPDSHQKATHEFFRKVYRQPEHPLVMLSEPSQTGHFNRFTTYRNLLCSLGATAVGPCLHSLSCPLTNRNDRCYQKFNWDPPPFVQNLAIEVGLEVSVLNATYCLFGDPFQVTEGWGRVVSNAIPLQSRSAMTFIEKNILQDSPSTKIPKFAQKHLICQHDGRLTSLIAAGGPRKARGHLIRERPTEGVIALEREGDSAD